MSKYVIKLDEQRCIGCRACEIQCQVKNRTPAAVRPSLLLSDGPGSANGFQEEPRHRAAAAFRPCFHCERPWCMAACPAGAIAKRPHDGIVLIDKRLCIGCRACIQACPWKVPSWDETTGKVVKCDLCQDRLAAGLQPACVAGCSTHALGFSRANDVVRKARALYAKSMLVDQGGN